MVEAVIDSHNVIVSVSEMIDEIESDVHMFIRHTSYEGGNKWQAIIYQMKDNHPMNVYIIAR